MYTDKHWLAPAILDVNKNIMIMQQGKVSIKFYKTAHLGRASCTIHASDSQNVAKNSSRRMLCSFYMIRTENFFSQPPQSKTTETRLEIDIGR